MKKNEIIYLGLILLVMSIVSCGKMSKSGIGEAIGSLTETKLKQEQMSFCEGYFIAIQVKNIVNNSVWEIQRIDSNEKLNAIISLLGIIKSNGYDDVIRAFTIPDEYSYQEKEVYAQSILQDLEVNSTESFRSSGSESYDLFGLFGNLNMVDIFRLVYTNNSKLKYPEIKTTFVEKLDNGNEIWLIQDYQSMTQARLIVQKDGGLSMGDLSDLETVITR